MPFVKGQSGNPAGAKRKVPPLLAAMRLVFEGKAAPKTAAEEGLAKLLAEDPKSFFAQMERLEKEFKEEAAMKAAAKRASKEEDGGVAGPAVEDAGTARCVEMCERLLREWEGGG